MSPRWKITAFLIGNFLIGIAGALFGMVGGFVAPKQLYVRRTRSFSSQSFCSVASAILGVSWWQLLSLWSFRKNCRQFRNTGSYCMH